VKNLEFQTQMGKVEIAIGYQPIDRENVLLKGRAVTIPKLIKAIPFVDVPDTFDKVMARQDLLALSDYIRAIASDFGRELAHE